MRRSKCLIFIAFIASFLLIIGGCSGHEIEINDNQIEQKEEIPPEPTDPELSWSADSVAFVYGSEYIFPTLSNPNKVKVDYSSTNEDVATISQAGEISIIASGSATIIATSPGTDKFTAGKASYTLTVEKADAGLEWSEDSCSAVYGEEVTFPILNNPNELEINWFSSDETVATISSEGEITILGAGSAIISACSDETGRYKACEVSYDLTVEKAPSGLELSESSINVKLGQEIIDLPVLSNPNELKVNWFSSDETVAAVSPEGEITILGAGSAIITASSAETTGFEAGSVSFTLSVGKNICEITWSTTTCNTKIGEENVFPSLNNPAGQKISYSSSDETVASISPDGFVILHSPGAVTITATALENDTHLGGNTIYTLKVEAQDIRLKNPALSWSVEKFEARYGSSPEFPALSNPNKLNVTYSSSSPDIAYIFSNGNILIKGIGTTTITASSKSNGTFAAGSVSYILSVVKAIPTLSWTEETCEVALGSDNSFPLLKNPDRMEIRYTSSNPSVATISSDGVISLISSGTTTIMASTEDSKFYEAASTIYTLEVNKAQPSLGWSANTCEAILASDNSFPTLNNPHGVGISYSSSNPSVASINQDGAVTIKGAGNTTIKATSKENDDYASRMVSYKLTVKKKQVALSWSVDDCSAAMNGSNTFPTLDNPSGVSVTYSSSNPSVASISSGGEIILIDKGSTTITAKFAGDNIFESATSSYTLKVAKSFYDDGAGSYKFPSTGDRSSDDDISKTKFSRMITVTFKEGEKADVTGDFHNFVSVDGNKVTVQNTLNDEFIIYKLTGSTSNGYFKLYSGKKQAIMLSDVSITNQDGAAINNQSGKRTFIVVEGTNTLSDKPSASYDSGNEDMKSVLFSEGQLVFSGSGSLTVKAVNKAGKSAIVSDDYVRFMESPTVKVISQKDAGNGIKANDYVQISSGELDISVAGNSKKGISSDDYVLVEGGTASINITGGVARDGKEYNGTAGIKADNYFVMSGGTVNITNHGDGGKGIRAGSYDYYSEHGSIGESVISGGTITIATYGNNVHDVASKGIKIGFKDKYIDGNFNLSGGSVDVKTVHGEALEVKGTLNISGGEHCFKSDYDDAINSNNGISITGGYTSAISSGNDAIDSNNDIRISGGVVYAICLKGPPEGSLDAMLEIGKKVYIDNGATVIAYGGIEPGAVFNQATYKMNVKPGGINALLDENGKALAVFKAPEIARIMIVSAPGLTTGLLGANASGGPSRCQGNLLFPTSISGGEKALLTTYIPTSIWEPADIR